MLAVLLDMPDFDEMWGDVQEEIQEKDAEDAVVNRAPELKQLSADQYKQQEVLWLKQSQRLTDIVKNNEGVWISTKLFYVVGSLSLLSIITIVLEIAFYVYFHWIQ